MEYTYVLLILRVIIVSSRGRYFCWFSACLYFSYVFADPSKNMQPFTFVSHQVVIFVKSVHRCVALSQLLVEQNFPAIAIHRGMAQEER